MMLMKTLYKLLGTVVLSGMVGYFCGAYTPKGNETTKKEKTPNVIDALGNIL